MEFRNVINVSQKQLTVYKLEPTNKAKIKDTCFVSIRQRKVTISCKHGNEPSVSITGGPIF